MRARDDQLAGDGGGGGSGFASTLVPFKRDSDHGSFFGADVLRSLYGEGRVLHDIREDHGLHEHIFK